ncbi:MAG: glycerophosphodiester phosphodiesterase [Opitutales bacterium]
MSRFFKLAALATAFLMTLPAHAFLVIAHRGASGYLPEHTLEAKALAVGMGAGAIEQDVVLTRDGVPIVLHDVTLDTKTDVATRFPGRARADGRFYAIDFDLEEIRTLRVVERFDVETGEAVYPDRFQPPAGQPVPEFRIPTLAEELAMIRGLERTLDRPIIIYPEIKRPAWHRDQGQDPVPAVLQTLADYGYSGPGAPVFLQCFDAETLKRIRFEEGSRLRLVQLIGENSWEEAPTDFDFLKTPEGIGETATYANGIGPWWPQCLDDPAGGAEAGPSALLLAARKRGLVIHPFTFRTDAVPEAYADFATWVRHFGEGLQVDGLFTDQPDRVLALRTPTWGP